MDDRLPVVLNSTGTDDELIPKYTWAILLKMRNNFSWICQYPRGFLSNFFGIGYVNSDSHFGWLYVNSDCHFSQYQMTSLQCAKATWNSLRVDLWTSSLSRDTFAKKLKTNLFGCERSWGLL